MKIFEGRFAGLRAVVFLLPVLMLGITLNAQAQQLSGKPVRMVVRAPAGGTDDLLARLMANAMEKASPGQRVVIDYRVGAGGLVAWEYVAKQPADGTTLLLAASGLGAIKSLWPDATIDPWRDFTWLSQVAGFQLIFTAHPSFPAKSVKDLVVFARTRPGQLNYGSSGVGATPHLAMELLKSMAKISIGHVPYKGAGPMYIDLISGRIELGTSVLASAIPHIRNGRLRGLAVSGAVRSPQLPEVPTVAESGLAGYEFSAFYALLMPGGASREVQALLSGWIGRAAALPELREQILQAGMEPRWNTPAEMLQLARKDGAQIEHIVRAANIKLQ